MREVRKKLLIIDGIVNVLLGVLLLLFPFGMAPMLGVPVPDIHFYPTILGAVLFGIGVALLIDAYGEPRGIRGLGIAGAIAINFCGAWNSDRLVSFHFINSLIAWLYYPLGDCNCGVSNWLC